MIESALLSFALGNLKRDLGAVWKWLCHRSFWQLTTMAAGLYIGLQWYQLADARHDRDAWRAQYTRIHTQLEAISSKRDEQKIVTRDNIKIVTRTIHDADGKAKEVEREPIPPTECHGVTPSAVRQADL